MKVCRRLKSSQETRDIPVIFISALDDMQDKVNGFEAGGVESSTARLTISDQGPGIPAYYRERIFDKYGQVESRQTGRKYSTGLGLTFCNMAFEAHGGSIGVESEEGKGSTFWLTLQLGGNAA